MWAALGVETLIALLGLIVYLNAKPNLRLRAKIGMPILMGFLILVTVGTQAFSPPPTNVNAPAASWIIVTILNTALVFWIDTDGKPK